jgi:subtilisin family serine protease
VRPIFDESEASGMLLRSLPSAAPDQLAAAIHTCIEAGACVLNLSVGLVSGTVSRAHAVADALDLAAARGVLVVAAAGNQGVVGSSEITRHRWVIPVAAFNARAQPLGDSNLGASVGQRGLGAPGEGVVSLRATGGLQTLGGTSAAAPFVTGVTALLWSLFPAATPAAMHRAIVGERRRPRSIVPPALDASAAYQFLGSLYGKR